MAPTRPHSRQRLGAKVNPSLYNRRPNQKTLTNPARATIAMGRTSESAPAHSPTAPESADTIIARRALDSLLGNIPPARAPRQNPAPASRTPSKHPKVAKARTP